ELRAVRRITLHAARRLRRGVRTLVERTLARRMRSGRTALFLGGRRRPRVARRTARRQRRREHERAVAHHQRPGARRKPPPEYGQHHQGNAAIVAEFTTRASPYGVRKLARRPVPRDRRIIPVYLASRRPTRVTVARVQEPC